MNSDPLSEPDNNYPKAGEELEGKIGRLVTAVCDLLLCVWLVTEWQTQ